MERFQIGEKVVHSPEGVCTVEEICEMELDERKRMCYRLQPITEKGRQLYIPVDSSRQNVRPLKTKEEVRKILSAEPDWNLLQHANTQKRMNVQNQAIREDDSELLIRLIKMYGRKRQSRQISVGDARWLRKAESYLLSELSEVLECDYGSLLLRVRYS